MANESLDANSIREKTKNLLGKDDIDYGYITDESIEADAALGSEAEVRTDEEAATLYGNNARYGSRTINGQNRQVYYFEHGGQVTNSNHACGTSVTQWALTDVWHHNYLGKCSNGREKWSFTQS